MRVGEQLRLDEGKLLLTSGSALPTPLAHLRPLSPSSSPTATFLRASIGLEESLHLWLEPDGGFGSSPSEAASIHRLGPYRLRVLSCSTAPVLPARGSEEVLGGVGTFVSVVVDKLLAIADLALEVSAEDRFWLSTQGATQASTCRPAPSMPSQAADVIDERFVCALPPLEPRSVLHPHESLGSWIEIRLHAILLSEGSGVAGEFGCAASEWRVELDAMSLGSSEGHVTLPLELATAQTAPRTVIVGDFELTLHQCIAHFSRAGPSSGQLVSDYPLLLLHVDLGLRRLPGELHEDYAYTSDCARKLADARRLGSELERLLS